MKKENIKYYIGMAVGIVGSISLWTMTSNKIVLSVLNLVFLWIFSYSVISMLDKKMLETDKEYRISMNDEREIRIREKTGETISIIFLLYFACLSIYFALNDNILVAALTGGVIFVYPLVYKTVSTIYSRRL